METFWISRDTEQIEYCYRMSKEVDMSDYWISDDDFCRGNGVSHENLLKEPKKIFVIVINLQ